MVEYDIMQTSIHYYATHSAFSYHLLYIIAFYCQRKLNLCVFISMTCSEEIKVLIVK